MSYLADILQEPLVQTFVVSAAGQLTAQLAAHLLRKFGEQDATKPRATSMEKKRSRSKKKRSRKFSVAPGRRSAARYQRMSTSPETLASIQLRLESRAAYHVRLERTRQERVRKGKRWVTEERTEEVWSEYGRAHIRVPVTTTWLGIDVGLWIRLEVPVQEPVSSFPSQTVETLVAWSAPTISAELAQESRWDFTSDFIVRTSAMPADLAVANIDSISVPLTQTGITKFNEWTERVRLAGAKLEAAKATIRDSIHNDSASYEHIASELRTAARFIAECDRRDDSPDRWMMDSFPERIVSSLEDLLRRKSASSHGFRVACESVRGAAYDSRLPEFWRDWPPT